MPALLVLLISIIHAPPARAQATGDPKPELRAGALTSDIRIDGRLDEAAWVQADAITSLTMTEPHEGATPSMATRVRVLASRRHLVIGIECDDPDPAGIVSFSKKRDPDLEGEDYVGIVIDTFLDGRSGYVFAVNPEGARFDGLVEPGGEHISESWDGIWEAATARTPAGWSIEFRIPLTTVSFKSGLDTWHFNVERRIERLQETDRWAGARRDWEISQVSRAGLLTGLPDFDLGLGLTVRPAVSAGGGIPEPDVDAEGDVQPSLDVWQKVGPNLQASLTVNTDFAETEVDTRRTNLTRFPLFFPEKRAFFLEGSDIFSFGLNLGQDVIPFFSRRIGLVSGREVPIVAGGKLNGRVDQTNAGALVTRTGDEEDVAPAATMGVARVKQNIWGESWIGAIATVGDPLGRAGAWTAGVDFTYATSKFRGDQNLLAGVWGLATGREDLGNDAGAWGGVVDYPNDRWDVVFSYKRIGRDFDPSLGFVPRRAIHRYSFGVNFAPRPNTWVRQTFYEFRPTIVTDLAGRWESYRVQVTPINWRLESGDDVEVGVTPTGERLVEPFEVSDGIVIAPGTYEWRRYEIQLSTASKRRLGAEVSWATGGFYDGELDTIELGGRWSPSALFTLQLSFERNIGRTAGGDFTEDVLGTRLELNLSPDLTLSSDIQYDNESESVGTNTRLRWTFRPEADVFVIYNHNVGDLEDRWRLDSNQLLVKMQYAWRR